MMENLHRRDILATGASLAGVTLAGCSRPNSGFGDDIVVTDTPQEVDMEAHPGAYLKPPNQPAEDLSKEGDHTSPTYRYIYPTYGDDLINLEIDWDDETITASINGAALVRPVTFHIGVDLPDKETITLYEETVEPRDEFNTYPPPFPEQYEPLEFTTEFDPEVVPDRVGSAVAFWAEEANDKFVDDQEVFTLAYHQILKIPYTTEQEGDDTYWLERREITDERERLPDNENYLSIFETFDIGDERVFICAVWSHDRLWGASTTINTAAYEAYLTEDGRQEDIDTEDGLVPRARFIDLFEAVHTADERNHVRTLAENLHEAHTAAGITDDFERLQATALLVQSLPYEVINRQTGAEKPIHTLYNMAGDCSDKALLFNAILNCEPYNTRTSGITCDFLVGSDPGRHMVVGIDERDLPDNAFDNNYIKTIEPDSDDQQDGIPDTEYAFLEPVDERFGIGDFVSNRYDIDEVLETSEMDRWG